MRILAIFSMAIFMTLSACATNQPSKYDGGEYDDCLLYQIAEKHGTTIESMGNIVRLAGLGGKASGIIDPQDAIDVYGKIKTALMFPVTGEAFVQHISFLAVEYQEILSIALSYAPDFAVPYTLDDQTVQILIDWCESRIAYYQRL